MTKTTKPAVREPAENAAPASPNEEELLKRIGELERRDQENQKKLEMLYAVADKGRVFNYESRSQEKKPIKVKLSLYRGKIVVGWRTVKDELITHPSTGATVGEVQEYELLLLDGEGKTEAVSVSGYVNFSNARYDQRVECEVVSRREDYDGKTTFELALPDGRKILVDSRFIN